MAAMAAEPTPISWGAGQRGQPVVAEEAAASMAAARRGATRAGRTSPSPSSPTCPVAARHPHQTDLRKIGVAARKLANHAFVLGGGLGFGTSFLKWLAFVAAV